MRKMITASVGFSFFVTLFYALGFGDHLTLSNYAMIMCSLTLFAILFTFYVTQKHARAENEALTLFGTAVTQANTTQEIDQILLKEVNTLLPLAAEVGILELTPFSDHATLRSGRCSDTDLANWLWFEKQTEDLIELHEQIFIRLCSRGGQTLFLVIQKNTPFAFYFRIHRQRFHALRAVVRTAYEKQFLVEGLTREIEDILLESPTASAKLTRLAFELAERERSRLALDLHDTALQDQLVWHRRLLELLEDDSISAKTKLDLSAVSEGMLDVVYQVREICTDLKPQFHHAQAQPNQHSSAFFAFDELLHKTRLRADFTITFDRSRFTLSLNPAELLIVYRIVQELLNNATKHSQAMHVHIKLESESGLAILRYSDDGVGIHMEDHAPASSGMGWASIRERSRALSGHITVHSAPDQGLQFELQFYPSNPL